jgi:hypothetical protein
VVLRGGGDPRTLFEVVSVLNAAAAPMIGNPIDDVGDAGQLAGAVISPFPKAICCCRLEIRTRDSGRTPQAKPGGEATM